MYIIVLTPSSKCSKSHIWVEGGTFINEAGAEFQAKQIRKMRDRYSRVEVILDKYGKKFASAIKKSSQMIQAQYSVNK